MLSRWLLLAGTAARNPGLLLTWLMFPKFQIFSENVNLQDGDPALLSKWLWLADTEAALLPRRSFGVFWTTGFPNRQSFSGGSPVCRKHTKQKSSGKTKKTEKTKKTKICRRDGLAPSPNSLANFGFFCFFFVFLVFLLLFCFVHPANKRFTGK